MKGTLVFIIEKNQVWLGMTQKKAGKPASGKWNGYGGKPKDEHELIRQTACRELFDETGKGLVAHPRDLRPCAIVDFYFFDNETKTPNWSVAIYIIQRDRLMGTFSDTEEMFSHWPFPFENLPFDEMMPGDREFLPKILDGETFTGEIHYNKDLTEIVRSSYTPFPQSALGI